MCSKTLSSFMDYVLEEVPSELSVISEEYITSKGSVTYGFSKFDIEQCVKKTGDSVRTEFFAVGETDYCKISFRLFPNGKGETTNHICLQIIFPRKLPDGAKYNGKLNILGKNGEISYSKEFGYLEHSLEMVDLESIDNTDNLKKYLYQDNLVVKCSIEIIVSSVQCASNQNSFRDKIVDLESLKFQGNLFAQKTYSDVTFRIHGGEVLAHKAVLALRNPVFRILFSGAPSSENYFKLKDIDKDTLEHLLHYIYTKEAPDLDFKRACDIYVAANNFKEFDLKNICLCYLAANLTTKNVFIVMSVAHKCSDSSLKKVCIDFIKNCNSDTLAKDAVLVTK